MFGNGSESSFELKSQPIIDVRYNLEWETIGNRISAKHISQVFRRELLRRSKPVQILRITDGLHGYFSCKEAKIGTSFRVNRAGKSRG